MGGGKATWRLGSEFVVVMGVDRSLVGEVGCGVAWEENLWVRAATDIVSVMTC